MGGIIPTPPSSQYLFIEGGEAENRLVGVTFAVAVILVIINAEVDVVTSASSTVRLSDISEKEGEGGYLTYHLPGRIRISLSPPSPPPGVFRE